MAWLKPLAKVVAGALNCMETKVAGVTLAVTASEVTVPRVAVKDVWPTPAPAKIFVFEGPAVTAPTLGSDVFHVTVDVRSLVVLSAYWPVAVTVTDVPLATEIVL